MKGGHAHQDRVIAVLGPTNTGKTHFAVERMLAHRTGMIGFPLRLLAREIYDRVVAIRGARSVALVTGEEKVGSDDASYLIATVEAMPVGRAVEFLAVDEIQLAADPSRGHVFTDRLLHARGTAETMFMGSRTAEQQIRRLIPRFELITRPRFSKLGYVGTTKLSRLQRRSAVVAFTANDVYALAELVRRQQGGAAVVLGALSPRTRNAQVEMYQSGEVDHLVATDAIGMGLNMDLAHVTFAKLHKFDGRTDRRLHAPEVGQIAGRAGRHMANGTFSVARGAGELDQRLVESVENHAFAPLRTFRWRNSNLDLDCLSSLRSSLDAPSPDDSLIRVRDALDDRSLALLAADETIRRRASRPASVRLLWQVCQIPDFRKTLTSAHLQMLATVFVQIADSGRLDDDWVATMVARLDQTEGEIDALVSRIAHIRTWTYLSHRDQWFDDSGHWQERTRAIEDRLSDALHERLTQRFVDRRTAALMRSIRERGDVLASISKDNEVLVDGHPVGKLSGLMLSVSSGNGLVDDALLKTAVRKAAKRPLLERATALIKSSHDEIKLNADDGLIWQGALVGRLRRGQNLLRPAVQLIVDDVLSSRLRAQMDERLSNWLRTWLGQALAPLFAIDDAMSNPQSTGAERGIYFRLVENLGSVPRQGLGTYISRLDKTARTRMARHGIRFGVDYVYIDALLKTSAIDARLRLLRIADWKTPAGMQPGAPVIRTRGHGGAGLSADLMLAIGYHLLDGFALRQDMFERLSSGIRSHAKQSPQFPLPVKLAPEAGISRAELKDVLQSLGYIPVTNGGGVPLFAKSLIKPARRRKRQRIRRTNQTAADSPFAALKALVPAT